jgi:threonine/homoserine/homoserine lactone efflux protein
VIPAPTLLAFTITSAVLILLPGPSVLFVIGRALSLGRAGALLSVLGNNIGVFAQSALVALGLGPIIQSSIVALTVIKFAGAGFLVYLGIQAIRHRKRLATTTEVAPRSKLRSLLEGMLVGVTNPKVIVFFIAILPQFVNVHAGNVTMQLLVLGGIFVTIGLICDGGWAIAASAARAWFARSPRRVETLGATGGVAMIGLGGVLALTGSKN